MITLYDHKKAYILENGGVLVKRDENVGFLIKNKETGEETFLKHNLLKEIYLYDIRKALGLLTKEEKEEGIGGPSFILQPSFRWAPLDIHEFSLLAKHYTGTVNVDYFSNRTGLWEYTGIDMGSSIPCNLSHLGLNDIYKKATQSQCIFTLLYFDKELVNELISVYGERLCTNSMLQLLLQKNVIKKGFSFTREWGKVSADTRVDFIITEMNKHKEQLLNDEILNQYYIVALASIPGITEIYNVTDYETINNIASKSKRGMGNVPTLLRLNEILNCQMFLACISLGFGKYLNTVGNDYEYHILSTMIPYDLKNICSASEYLKCITDAVFTHIADCTYMED